VASYTASTTTRDAAVLAAQAWGATTISDAGYCDPYCIAGQKADRCAIWCYGISNAAGRVRELAIPSCSLSVCPSALGPTWPTVVP
jgi:hypothetical protein